MRQSIIHFGLSETTTRPSPSTRRKLGFTLIKATQQPEQAKRWVVVASPGGSGAAPLLGQATTPEQEHFIGIEAGGRVSLFLRTDDF